MYPHHVFNLEPAGTFGMYPICYWRVSGRYFQPEPAMYSRCFHWFPGPLTPSVHGDLEEEVYMAVPQGLEDILEGYVLKLKKALYGLKQASRQWYENLHKTMKDFGLKRAESDPHTFVFNGKISGVTHTLVVPVYIDDIFLFGSKTLTNQFEEFIPQYYDITDPCDAQYLLGICVT